MTLNYHVWIVCERQQERLSSLQSCSLFPSCFAIDFGLKFYFGAGKSYGCSSQVFAQSPHKFFPRSAAGTYCLTSRTASALLSLPAKRRAPRRSLSVSTPCSHRPSGRCSSRWPTLRALAAARLPGSTPWLRCYAATVAAVRLPCDYLWPRLERLQQAPAAGWRVRRSLDGLVGYSALAAAARAAAPPRPVRHFITRRT